MKVKNAIKRFNSGMTKKKNRKTEDTHAHMFLNKNTYMYICMYVYKVFSCIKKALIIWHN